MDAETFRVALARLHLTYKEGATALRVASAGRIGDYAAGRRPIPPYIAAHAETLVRLHEAREEIKGLRAALDEAKAGGG